MTEPARLAEIAASIAQEAGQLLAAALHHERTVDTKSTATDMVTEMDTRSEALIVARLQSERPDDAIVGEEGTDVAGTSGITWIIDPLDGTTNYLYRHPGWNVSIGAEIDDTPVAGAVAIPSTGDLFVAARGDGATAGGRRLEVGSPPTMAPPTLAGALVGTGFNYAADMRTRQGETVAAMIGRVRDIRRMGAAAADLCGVAAGRLDAYFEQGLGHWDHCAGTVIAREAGAIVEFREAAGTPGTVVVAAHPALFDEFVELLVDVGACR